MLIFLVEAYVGRTDTAAIGATVDRLIAATSGTGARLRSAYHLPADETCLYVLQASDVRAVTRVLNTAGLDATRTTQVLDWSTDRTAPTGAASPQEDR